MNKAFKKVHDHIQEPEQKKETKKSTDKQQPTAQQELEALQAKKKAPVPTLHFSPPGVIPQKTVSKEDAERVAQLKGAVGEEQRQRP